MPVVELFLICVSAGASEVRSRDWGEGHQRAVRAERDAARATLKKDRGCSSSGTSVIQRTNVQFLGAQRSVPAQAWGEKNRDVTIRNRHLAGSGFLSLSDEAPPPKPIGDRSAEGSRNGGLWRGVSIQIGGGTC